MARCSPRDSFYYPVTAWGLLFACTTPDEPCREAAPPRAALCQRASREGAAGHRGTPEPRKAAA